MSTPVRHTRYTPGPDPLTSSLTVADGAASAETNSGSSVGRFGRLLDDPERVRLDAAIASAGGLGAVVQPAGTGTVERVIADGVDLALAPPDDPPAAAAALVEALRELGDDLEAHPVAALRLAVDAVPGRALLEHAGTEPLPVRLGTLTLEATAYDADSMTVDSVTATVAVDVDGPLEPGWSLLLADVALDVPADGFVVVRVGPTEVDVDGSGTAQPAHLVWMTP